jgi:hypothetical protein
MRKDKGGPLVLGPIWDLNEAFGVCCGYPIEGRVEGGWGVVRGCGAAVQACVLMGRLGRGLTPL